MKRNVVLMQVYEETRQILREFSSKTTIDMQELIDSAVKEKYRREVLRSDEQSNESSSEERKEGPVETKENSDVE